MIVTVEVPDQLARQYHLDEAPRSRQLLEAFLLQRFAEGELTSGQVGGALGFSFHSRPTSAGGRACTVFRRAQQRVWNSDLALNPLTVCHGLSLLFSPEKTPWPDGWAIHLDKFPFGRLLSDAPPNLLHDLTQRCMAA
jgi:hypothetical protein